jgi:hypothetical protein
MPDGSQQPPVDPNAQRAQDQMRDWKEKHRDPNAGGGWFGNVFASVDELFAAAEAGQFAVSPDTGAAIVKQLTDVHDQVNQMKSTGTYGVTSQRLGGGYATNIAQFNQQVNQDGQGTVLQKFMDELEQLKSAVQRSMANYGNTDSASGRRIDSAGGGR